MPRKLCTFLFLFLALPALADQLLEQGDELARWGAYREADQAYLASQAPEVTVKLRRLALAENMMDEALVDRLARELESRNLGTEARLQVSMARATLAARSYRFKDARQHYQAALKASQGSNSTSAILARYACQSYLAMEEWERNGVPSPEQFKATLGQLAAPLAQLSPTAPYPALEYTRAAQWNRIWIWYAMMLGAEDPAKVQQWAELAGQLVTANVALAADRSVKGQDPEAGYMASHYVLDLADNIFLPTGSMAAFRQLIEQWLANGDAILAARGPTLGNPRFLEQEELKARWYRVRAHASFEQGKVQEAHQDWKTSADLFASLHQPFDQADTLTQAAYLLWASKGVQHREQAARYAQEALSISGRLDYLLGQAWGGWLLGHLHMDAQQFPQAEKAFRGALEVNEQMVLERGAGEEGRARLLNRYSDVTENLIKALLAQGKKAEAMDALRRHQARELISGLDLGKVDSSNNQVRQALNEVEKSRESTRRLSRALASERSRPDPNPQEVNRISTELGNSKAQYHQALNRIKASEPEYERLVSIRPANFSKIQGQLPKDAVLVQYFAGEEKLYIFVATSEDLAVLESPVAAQDLRKEVLTMCRGLRRKSETLPQLESLYGHLIAPVESFLGEGKTLVVAPSEFLYQVPFAALRKGDRYLVERLDLVTVTSLEVLTLFQEKAAQKPAQLFAFGDPDGSLPSARKEVSEVSALFPKSTVLVAEKADKKSLNQLPAGTSVVHFATHGVLNPRDVNSTYLVMAGQGEEGKLTVGEIYGLPLEKVDLVTLSACETQVGEGRSVAEIASLAQAFSVAGSPTMVASLWKVDDESTYRLMVGFYKALLGGKRPAQALGQAQRELLKDPAFQNPYFWAAFELLGDWR